MTEYQCPNCGAISQASAEDIVLVCANCNSCFTTQGAVIKEHYLLPAHYSSSASLERLILWIKKQIGADEELPLHLEVRDAKLAFYPFWNIQVKAASSYVGIGTDASYSGPDGFNEFRHIHKTTKRENWSFDRIFSLTYPASQTIPRQLLGFEFPTRAKKYFSQSYSRESGGRVLSGILTQEAVESFAKEDAERRMTAEIMREVREVLSRDDKIDVSSVYYMHVPIWELVYKFGGKDYQAFIDASTGRVIHATYPVSLEHRLSYGMLGGAHLVAGFIAGGLGLAGPLRFLLPLAAGAVAIGITLLIRGVQLGRAKEAAR